MESQGFDQAAYDRELGLTDDGGDDVAVAEVNSDGKDALRQLTDGDPTGIKTTGSQSVEGAEYAEKRAITADVEPEINWLERYVENFGATPSGDQPVTAESYHIEAARRIGEAEYLAQYDGADQQLQAIINRQIDPIELIQHSVRQQLADNGLKSDTTYTDRIDALIQNGELTPEGRREYEAILKTAKNQLDHIRQQAAEHGQQFAEFRTKFYEVLPKQVDSMLAIWGIKMELDDKNRLMNRVKARAGDGWLGEYKSVEDAAQKDVLITIFSDPYLLAKRDKAIYQLGFKAGKKHRYWSPFELKSFQFDFNPQKLPIHK